MGNGESTYLSMCYVVLLICRTSPGETNFEPVIVSLIIIYSYSTIQNSSEDLGNFSRIFRISLKDINLYKTLNKLRLCLLDNSLYLYISV